MGQTRDPGLKLRKQALDAVQDGKLSVEEILEEALKRSAGLRNWLSRRLKDTREQEPRRLQVRHVETLPAAVVQHALDVARRRFGGYSGVRHMGWGVKYTQGRATARDAVLILVDEKRSSMKAGEPERIPASISFSFKGRRYRVATDVRPYARHGVKQQDLRPGDQCEVEVAGSSGTLSGVVKRFPEGWLALLSGHVARKTGAAVIARGSTGLELDLGTVVKCRNDEDVDAALAGPVEASSISRLSLDPAECRDLPLNAPRVRLKLLLRKGEVTAFVDSVSEPVEFGTPYRPQPMRGLIRLDGRRSEDGDSGAPAVDSGGRVVGFVVGCAPSGAGEREHTYLLPARRVFDELI